MIAIGDTIPHIACQHQRQALQDTAGSLFKQDSMRRAARFAASVHVHAAEYVAQAPVLALAVLAGGGQLNGGKANEAYAAFKFGALCQRGARLKEIMSAYGLPLPMRKITAKALTAEDEGALTDIAALGSSTISQIIPTSIAAQRRWLGAINAWRACVATGGWGIPTCPPWAIVQLAKHRVAPRMVDVVADFHIRGDLPINPAWEWQRAVAAAEDWHDRLSAGDAKARYGVMVDQVVDFGNHPDHAVVGGYEFVALRTPLAIHAEGRAMRHCVGSYVQSVVNGACSIVSIRQDERRIATLEMVQQRTIRQLKGRFNSLPAPAVLKAAKAYLADVRSRAA